MRDDRYLGGVLCHYGVLGMKWGVRRSPEQLGGGGGGSSKVENTEKSVTIKDGYYKSDKGFYVPTAKLQKYCLNPERKHSKEFFEDGYTKDDGDKLFRDIESGFDLSKKQTERKGYEGRSTYSIPMTLGITRKREYTTAWCNDGPDESPRFVTAYLDRRVQKGE